MLVLQIRQSNSKKLASHKLIKLQGILRLSIRHINTITIFKIRTPRKIAQNDKIDQIRYVLYTGVRFEMW